MGIGNRRVLVLAACAAVLVGVASTAPLPESVLAAAPARPTILGAQVDHVAGTLTIQGQTLGGAEAVVTLGGAALEVSSATEETIVAALPADAAGSLLLTVSAGNRADRFAVNIPATSIVTPAGITIQSTEAGVQILAGGSRIIVEQTGAIRIESSGPLHVRTPGALDLRGNSVSIRSDTSMALSAGTALDVNGLISTSVRGSQVAVTGGSLVTVTGGLIKLN
jgi:hypothetical protein